MIALFLGNVMRRLAERFDRRPSTTYVSDWKRVWQSEIIRPGRCGSTLRLVRKRRDQVRRSAEETTRHEQEQRRLGISAGALYRK